MKQSSLLFLLFFCLVLVACDDEDDEPTLVVFKPDTVHPVISVTSPAANDTLLVYEENEIIVNITDNSYLRDVRVYLEDPVCTDINFDCIPVSHKFSNEQVSISRGNSTVNWNITIPIPSGSFRGTNTFTVEAEDGQQNVTKNSFTIIVHAPELDLTSFSTTISPIAFGDIDNGDGFLDYKELGAAFYGYVNTGLNMDAEVDEDEWNWFVDVNGLENQTWSDWDTNSDDFLQPTEFSRGLENAGFLAEWDLDNNGLLSEEEFANYLFSRLDHDGNGVLSSNEYVNGLASNHWF